MKTRWLKKSLVDLCGYSRGLTYSKSDEVDASSNIVLRATNINLVTNSLCLSELKYINDKVVVPESKKVKKGSLLICMASGSKSHLGKVAYIDDNYDFAFGGFMGMLTPKDTLDSKYLFYLMISDQYKDFIGQLSDGININNLKYEALREFLIPLPPLPEQRRIVGILDKAFESIAIAKAKAEKNLQINSEILQSIINLAISGKLTQEWRRLHPGTETELRQLEKALDNRREKKTSVGKHTEPQSPIISKRIDIPANWTLASPEQISTHIVDCPHSTPKWSESGVVCLRTTNFKPWLLDLESVRFVSEETYKKRILRLEPKSGDILYSREGGILGIACIMPPGLRACLGQRMMQFRLDESIALPQYFASVLNSPLILSEVSRLTGGAASPHLNIRDIRTMMIPLPPMAEQHEIVNKLENVTAETQNLNSLYQRKIALLDKLKKSLLHKAFNGEL
jgi:type I restriction enzyme, S subunit